MLHHHLDGEHRYTRQVAAGRTETGDETEFDWIQTNRKDNWGARGRGLGCERRRRADETVLDRLGITKEIKAKSTLNARGAATPNAEIVARGEAELGIQLISEIVGIPGADLLGPLPPELQAMTVVSAGILTTATEPDAARVLFKFLTSPAAAGLFKAAGMEPGGS